MSSVHRQAALSARRGGLLALYGLLLAANLGAWVWALVAARDNPVMLGAAGLAYAFGLRHAADADHIAAIDNVTRKLVQEGKRPLTVGFWFSIGHSAVVAVAAAVVAMTAADLARRFAALTRLGALLGTLVSVVFLLLIALINGAILVDLWKAFRAARRGGRVEDGDFDRLLNNRGLLARWLSPLFRLVNRPWHMALLGFLFGLGFDTATEVSLLAIAAVQAGKGVPTWTIMVFPALFAAGMALIDTTDGVLMLGAYDWAFVRPRRKLIYNLIITGVSVLVAVIIGGIEALGLVGGRLGLSGGLWDLVRLANDHFTTVGFAIIGGFITVWILAVIAYRYTSRRASDQHDPA